jgi:hypothetical protein
LAKGLVLCWSQNLPISKAGWKEKFFRQQREVFYKKIPGMKDMFNVVCFFVGNKVFCHPEP